MTLILQSSLPYDPMVPRQLPWVQPPIGLQEPVADYDASIAARVQRMFIGVRPVWRFNGYWYADPTLHQPRSANARRDDHGATTGTYLRSERQGIVRLPRTDAMIFSIHTSILGGANSQKDRTRSNEKPRRGGRG